MFSNYYYNFISKIMETIKKVLNWIIWSSANSKNISLTLRALVPFLVMTGVASSEDLETTIGLTGEIFVQLGALASGIVAIYGLTRKITLTLKK
jgi:hypothetical protein